MILQESNVGTSWLFSEAECADFAYICSCMPTDRMKRREAEFIRKMEARFRGMPGGCLTPGQWNWFAEIANHYSAFILAQDTAVLAIREAASSLADKAGVA